jgi:tetratricopeptide (TPR) repeat protein
MERPSQSMLAMPRWFVLGGTAVVAIVIGVVAAFRSPPLDVPYHPAAFTIYVLGGSTAEGVPYCPEVDIGRIAALCFGSELNGREIRVQSLAQSSMPTQFVLEQARAIARSVTAPETALVFVYCGNNEFLEFDPAQDVSTNTRSLFDTPIVPHDTRKRVLESYRHTMAEVIAVLQDAEIPLVFSTVAVNQKDWQPNRSVLADPEHEPRVEQLWQSVDKATKNEQWQAARRYLEEIIDIEPRFAHASYRLGKVCQRLDDNQIAKLCFQRAIDNDGNPTRAVSAQNEVITELCSQHGVPLVDASAILEDASADGLIGYNMMWDNCHPTLEGYVLIARALADQIGQVAGATPSNPELTCSQVRKRFLTEQSETDALAERAQYCYVSSLITWDGGPRLNRAEHYLNRAIAQRPEDADIVCSLGVLQLLQDQVSESLLTWKRAYRLDRIHTQQRISNPHIHELFRANFVDDPLSIIAKD